ncbi:serine/threonine protein kinase [Streptomyces cinnamoneus]|uniref:Serine/threonine protein kinase n=1 Tax=Streptomyces cinnamoneus TaxID=53446 RepID=A0A2G1XHH0_STRCJ|nr:protein kinase family protein [Streptomyces cinnamoneus]PHQ50667.1 serine/threonine protein kinase [Streptomyces cinnamoneus]PPT14078.1 serine/threonine protein kinase [Streptomyces cinnamoneus]
MAERSTTAVDVADNSGDQPLTAEADQATTDGAETGEKAGKQDDTERAESKSPARDAQPPDLHSGHKLARRYRLEECVTRLEGFSSWRAVDEKLRRAVGVHLLPADHPRARPVLAAARSAALLGDPRFVQVLDAVEENDLVYVVHEWLPDATELTPVLASGPLEPYDAYQLVSQVSQAMAAAHREGLAHLRLNPGSVLRTETGQYRIRGLAVMAALRGITSEHPQRTDTEAIGALLYAALTQRWPYEGNAHGLSGLPKGVGLIAPDQVRAGVHRGLSELAMRALVNDGATASRQEKPCTTPEELAKAVAVMPRIRPPESTYATPPTYPRAQPAVHGGAPAQAVPVAPPPPLQSRTGKALKWSVSALLIAALGLGSWQLADTLLKDGESDTPHSQSSSDDSPTEVESKPIKIEGAHEYAPDGKFQHPGQVRDSYDGDPETSWRSLTFNDGPKLAPYKDGVGIVYDLGEKKQIDGASVKLLYGGDHTTVTLYAANSPSASLDSMKKLAHGQTSTTESTISLKEPRETRYVLLWITEMPYSDSAHFSGAGYKQGVVDVQFTG